MKLLFTGLGTAIVLLLLLFRLGSPDAPERPGTVTIVAARDVGPWVSARMTSSPAPAPVTDMATVREMRADEDPLPARDVSAMAELFSAQPRDALWADRTERLLTSHLGARSSVACALYLCRVRVPLAAFHDRRAEAAAIEFTRNWPSDISYNPLTAQIVGRGFDRTLAFYVTRNDAIEGGDQNGSVPGLDPASIQ